MPTSDASHPPMSPDESKFSRRPAEIDQFVDHFLATMCDPSRRQILELLTIPDGNESASTIERRSGDIAKALGLTPATTSGHLRQLSDAGLISSRREGNVIYYRASNYMLVRAFRDLLVALDKEHAARFGSKSG